MNRLTFAALMLSMPLGLGCTREVVVDSFKPGVCVAECQVGAGPGKLSVLVETAGPWRLRCDSDWLETDVEGGKGRGAFTFRYASNLSDILHLREPRVGTIAICLDDEDKADTLRIVQQGFLQSTVKTGAVSADPALRLEYDRFALAERTLIVVQTDGMDEAVRWAEGKADVLVVDGTVTGSLDGIMVKGVDLTHLDPAEEYRAFREAVDEGLYAAGPGGWILCGGMGHYSMMQTDYPDTPAWYPSDAQGDDFLADRYAWQKSMFDILWMKERNFVSTYSDGDGRSWAADYVYVSPAVLSQVADVQLLDIPVPGMKHRPVIITLVY